MSTQTDSDRLWSELDKTNQYMDSLEQRVLRLETTRAPSEPEFQREQGSYLPVAIEPSAQDMLSHIRAIICEFEEPFGGTWVSPAQRLLLRIKAVVG